MCRHPFDCIIPSYVLEQVLNTENAAVRARAMQTLMFSERTRVRRATLANVQVPSRGKGLDRTIYDMQHDESAGNLPGKPVRREGQAPTGDAAADEAYDGLGHTYAFYKEVLDRDSMDGRGMRLDASVHFGQDFNNAFWNGTMMVFGDGDGQAFVRFTKGLDVIAHELTHAVTEFTAGLDYHKQPGALNESFSDVFGVLVKQRVRNETAAEADWLIGADIVGPAFKGKALRSMKAPGTAYNGDRQPKHMRKYQDLPDTYEGDWGGVHINSGIPNHAFYCVAQALGGYAWQDAGRIWYQTLLALNQKSSFADCAATSVAIAGRDYGIGSNQHRAVEAAWKEVGVTQEDAQARKLAKRPPKFDGKVYDLERLEPGLRHLASALNEVLEAMGAS